MIEENPLARDRISQVYLGKVGDEETQIRARARINWLADQIDHSSVLDVGCSEGILPILLGRKGIKVTGVDINPEAIEFANELISSEDSTVADNVTFICTDFIKDCPEESQYDYVILGEIIEHFSKPDILINKAINFIKPGGVLLVTTPFGYFPDPDHHYTFTLSNFLKFFKSDNLTPIFLTVENGYIRFLAEKTIFNRQSWNEFQENLLELNEQSFLKEQKIFYDRVNRLREQQRELSNINKSIASKNTKMEDQIRTLEDNFSNLKRENERLSLDLSKLRNENERLNLDLSNLKRENERLSLDLSKLRDENEILITKYKGLIVRNKMIINSSAYQLSITIREAFNPISRKTLLLPITFLKFFIRWLKKKNRVQNFVGKSTNFLSKYKIKRSNEFDELTQENSFLNSLDIFIQKTNLNPEKPIILITTTTKRMGGIKRLNRSMAFAHELAKMSYPVIYVYYRWKPQDDKNSDYDGSTLLQIPNDIFHKMAPNLARIFKNKQKLFLISIPDAHSVSELTLFKLHNWKVIYEVRDDWSEFSKAGVGKWYDPTFEIFLCSNSDYVTAVSNRLLNKMIDFGSDRNNSYIIPNGLTDDFLSKSVNIFNRRVKGHKGKGIIGYFGHLTEKWFNWDLLLNTASLHPELEFEIIGFDAPISLNLPANVKLLGEKTHDEIIQIAENWSLAIIPFKNNDLAKAVDPIKLYEYQALGLPTVSCFMDQIKDYPFVHLYENDEDFYNTLLTGLDFKPLKTDWEKLKKFISNNLWKNRVLHTLKVAEIEENNTGGMSE